MQISKIKFSAVLFAVILFCPSLQAQIRIVEPIVVTGADLSTFAGAPVESLYLYAYINEAWEMIPMQIDERSAGGSLFESDDGLLDANDELIFQPQDGGAATDTWILDVDSRNYSRVRLTVTDAVQSHTIEIYLYRSGTLDASAMPDYINYNADNDEVLTDSYRIGFDDDKKFIDELFFKENGGYSADLVDRQKTRIKGQQVFTSYSLTEDDFNCTNIYTKVGKIRVSRKTEGYFSVSGVTQNVSGMGQFYKEFFATPEDSYNIHSSVNMLRNSIDLTAGATGAIASDENNATIAVDGSTDGDLQENISSALCAHYWAKLKFSNNSLVTVGDFSQVASSAKVYYHDDSSGGTADGTADTGDGASWGDMGVKFDNPNSGQLVLSSKAYFGIGVDISGPICQSYFDSPLTAATTEESYVESGVEDSYEALRTFCLHQNYPNPFNPETTLKFDMPQSAHVRLTVYDVKGREVAVLKDDVMSTGRHCVVFNAARLPSGIYTCCLKIGNVLLCRKMLYLK